MDLARLKRLLEAHGAEPRRWPQDERRAALDLLARSAEARAAHEAAAALDRLLGTASEEDAAAAAALRARLSALAAGSPRRTTPRWSLGPWPLRRLWPQAAALAAAAVIGFVVGVGHPAVPPGDDPDLGDLAGIPAEPQP
jgi:hypothetical protein